MRRVCKIHKIEVTFCFKDITKVYSCKKCAYLLEEKNTKEIK